MASMFAIASVRSWPMARPEPVSLSAGACADRSGVGVAGTVAPEPVLAAGAAGTAGVEVDGWAGVAGGAAAAGAGFSALGC